MDRRTVILLGVALVAAIVAAWAVRSWMAAQEPQVVAEPTPVKQQDSGTEVLVAASNLRAGLIVTPEHLRWQSWPSENVSEAYVTRKAGAKGDFVGSVARGLITSGEPVTSARMVKPGERGFLAAVLSPDMRAVTVPVNPTSGVAGFVFPGDRVDMIVTHQVAGSDGGRRRASETVLTDVRVLAVDQKTEDVEGKPSVASTVTLEVTPRQVEEVAVARQLGTLSLSLRSLPSGFEPAMADGEPAGKNGLSHRPPQPGNTVTWDSQVSEVLGGAGPGSQQNVVVMRGGKSSAQNFQKVDQ